MFSRVFQSDPETIKSFRKITTRSTAYVITAYYGSFILEKSLIIIGAFLKGFAIELKYNYVKVIADYKSWDQETILLIYLIPFFLQVLALILLYIRFNNMAYKVNYLKLFLLWFMFFIVYRLFGLFPGHIMLKTGIYHVFDWLYISLTFRIIAASIAAVIFIMTGFQIFRGIIILSGTYHNHIRNMGISNLILASIIYPILILILVNFLYYSPQIPDVEILGGVLILLLNTYTFLKMMVLDPNLFSYKEKVTEQRNPGWILTFSLVGVIFLRIILDKNIIGS